MAVANREPWIRRQANRRSGRPQTRGRAENLFFLNEDEKTKDEELTVGRGKVEIQNQDSHFSTAQISLRRKEKAVYTKRLTRPTGTRLRGLSSHFAGLA